LNSEPTAPALISIAVRGPIDIADGGRPLLGDTERGGGQRGAFALTRVAGIDGYGG